MSFLTGPMRKHLDGHKDLTDHGGIVKIPAGSNVYIPLINMNSTAVEVIVKEGDKVKVGTKVAFRNDHFNVPMFSSVSGTVKGVEKMMHSSLKSIDHLVIENDGNYEQDAPLKPLDYQKATVDELVDFMMNMGLVGCGGAGFPTYIKYKGVKDIHTLIINGVECEPYLTADYVGIKENLDVLVLGMQALKKVIGCQSVKVCIKNTKKEFIPVLKEAVKGLEGFEVVEVPDVYPMGWERTLVHEVTKKRYDRLPSEIGIVVNNVMTVIAFAHALKTGMPIVEKIITMSGNGVNKPQNVLVPVGIKVSEIVEQLGGYTSEEILLIAGGPMMGNTVTTDNIAIGPYSGAMTILKNEPVNTIACLRCGKCTEFCPAGLQPVRIAEQNKAKNFDALERLTVNDCIECGMCSYICPSKIDVTENVRKAKRLLALKKK